MFKTRRILFAQCAVLFACNFVYPSAHASGTKVGNGDDGADLEALSPITAGPISDSRQQAVELLNKLNVKGIPGLGALYPELQRTDLMMASQDVHPTGELQGSLEISDDRRSVYARTFPEAYASTRFFPATLQLTPEQLMALHVHEALHRSLPSEIRTNEDIVMHLTMAMTSPGASHDRVRQVSSIYLDPLGQPGEVYRGSSLGIATSLGHFSAAQVELPPTSRTEVGYQLDGFNEGTYLQGLEVKSSLGGYRRIRSFAVEPLVRARMKLSSGAGNFGVAMGPSSYDLAARVQVTEERSLTPFFRFTAQALETKPNRDAGRDIVSFGTSYEGHSTNDYFEATALYSLGSSAIENTGYTVYGTTASINLDYKSIFSFTARGGYRWGRLSLGGMGELHSSGGINITSTNAEVADVPMRVRVLDSFRLLVAGPELAYTGERFQMRAYYKMLLNSGFANLSDLGDMVDRGAGKSAFGTSLSMKF
jgi:hypothetical protein